MSLNKHFKDGGTNLEDNEIITEKAAPVSGEIMLFATRTCPNCKMAEMFLDKAGISFKKIYADENAELTAKYEIRQAPTLIITDGERFDKIVNVSNIRKYIEERT